MDDLTKAFVPYRNKLPYKVQIARVIWKAAYLTLFRLTPRWLGYGWRRMLLRLFGATIGRGCKIDPSCRIWAPWNLEMGQYSALGEDVDCYSVDRVIIGSKACVSQRTFLCTASHDIESLRRDLVHSPVVIGDHAWVAAESFIAPGVTIGNGAVVGARAAVFKDVAAWTVVGGNPARVIKQRVLRPATADG